ncbi:hypothetical protein PHLGIDRAFT_455954 [Phlebiopsis gigantea 11061_1 CR5-6]|uniref:Uncharacterized protein n=1 Tax=Phlebiopsis gigantea (strain 11061_1 CR5-6) TaxID=745531 RepID=A0A0C3SF67_PHLG1|nr:hypothetical protein PHLGIDRAFT_455954 [Phlebiopsis gigantea 11061_1 CR5-6]
MHHPTLLWTPSLISFSAHLVFFFSAAHYSHTVGWQLIDTLLIPTSVVVDVVCAFSVSILGINIIVLRGTTGLCAWSW